MANNPERAELPPRYEMRPNQVRPDKPYVRAVTDYGRDCIRVKNWAFRLMHDYGLSADEVRAEFDKILQEAMSNE